MSSDPLPFRRAAARDSRVADHGLDVTLMKGDRSRRFLVRPGPQTGQWLCQIWMGTQTQHRGETTDTLQRTHQLKAEYFREIDELERDGWQISAGVDPRPARP